MAVTQQRSIGTTTYRTEAIALTILAALVLALMGGQLHRLPLLIPEDVNEGWNAYHALSAMSGSLSYPPVESFVTNNYPPLSFYIVGAFGRLVGDNVIAGRIIALLSELLVAVNIFLITRQFGARPFVAGFTALLFLFYIDLTAIGYVAMDDPQWLGHALATSGAVLFLRHGTGHRQLWQLSASSALCVAAVFIKHNLVVLPLALALWSMLYQRKLLIIWMTSCLLIGAAALALTLHLFGVAFLQDVLAHKRPLMASKLVRDLARYGEPLAPLLLCTTLLCRTTWQDRNVRFLAIYAAVAAALGIFFLAGAGIDANVLFDLNIALVIASGLFISRLSASSALSQSFSALAAAAVLVIGYLPLIPSALVSARDLVRQDHADRLSYQKLISLIQNTAGPVACEEFVVCYWAHKPFEIDFFNYGAKLALGAVDPRVLGRRLDDGYYAAFEVRDWPASDQTELGKWLGGDLLRRLSMRYEGRPLFDDEWLLTIPSRR